MADTFTPKPKPLSFSITSLLRDDKLRNHAKDNGVHELLEVSPAKSLISQHPMNHDLDHAEDNENEDVDVDDEEDDDIDTEHIEEDLITAKEPELSRDRTLEEARSVIKVTSHRPIFTPSSVGSSGFDFTPWLYRPMGLNPPQTSGYPMPIPPNVLSSKFGGTECMHGELIR